MANGKRLGRGLETLLGRIGSSVPSEVEMYPLENPSELCASESQSVSETNKIDITKIEPNPFQPRKIFDEIELEQLSQSLSTQGLLQPIVVRKMGERYQIIAGERRFRASLRLGWSEIPAIIFDADDQQMAELALTENIQRKDLNPIEKATSFANYLEQYGGTHEELAKRLEVDRSTVSNLLRLLKLPKQLQDAVCNEQITAGHVRALIRLSEEQQIKIAEKILAEDWSVRQTELYVQELRLDEVSKSPEQNWRIVNEEGESTVVTPRSEQIRQLEDEIRHHLGGMKVSLVQTNAKGKGKLVIAFASHAEFERVYAALCKSHRSAG